MTIALCLTSAGIVASGSICSTGSYCVTDRPIPLFVNPVAGRGRAGKNSQGIADILAANGVSVALFASKAEGDLEERIFEHAKSGRGPVIVAGGDGSVHEAVNGILAAGTKTPLGLIPIGTGNDFAKACAIPLDWKMATRLLADRIRESVPVRYIDAARMNDRFFANGAGIGFDAKVNRIARKYTWPIGDLVYLFAVLEGMWDGVITPTVTMRYAGKEYTGRITLANISNGPWVGGMFYIAPMAMNDDGHLDLVFAAPVSRLRILGLLGKLIRGTHIEESEISYETIDEIEIVADEPVPSHLDGETQALQTTFRIEILRDALGIL
jgi:diacylglycerol kinase (ATP)